MTQPPEERQHEQTPKVCRVGNRTCARLSRQHGGLYLLREVNHPHLFLGVLFPAEYGSPRLAQAAFDNPQVLRMVAQGMKPHTAPKELGHPYTNLHPSIWVDICGKELRIRLMGRTYRWIAVQRFAQALKALHPLSR